MSHWTDCEYSCGCMADVTGVCECFDLEPAAPDDPTPAALAVLGLDDHRLRFIRWMVQTGRLSDQIAPETRLELRQDPRSLSVGLVMGLTAALVALWLVMVLEIS